MKFIAILAPGAKRGRKGARPRGLGIAENFCCFECPEDFFGNVPLQHAADSVPEIILGALKAGKVFCDSENAWPHSFSPTWAPPRGGSETLENVAILACAACALARAARLGRRV